MELLGGISILSSNFWIIESSLLFLTYVLSLLIIVFKKYQIIVTHLRGLMDIKDLVL